MKFLYKNRNHCSVYYTSSGALLSPNPSSRNTYRMTGVYMKIQWVGRSHYNSGGNTHHFCKWRWKGFRYYYNAW